MTLEKSAAEARHILYIDSTTPRSSEADFHYQSKVKGSHHGNFGRSLWVSHGSPSHQQAPPHQTPLTYLVWTSPSSLSLRIWNAISDRVQPIGKAFEKGLDNLLYALAAGEGDSGDVFALLESTLNRDYKFPARNSMRCS